MATRGILVAAVIFLALASARAGELAGKPSDQGQVPGAGQQDAAKEGLSGLKPDAGNLTGQYEPLSLWGKIKLGSAYFTNPQLAKGSSLAYHYNLKDFASAGNDVELWKLASEGKITFGIPDQKGKLTALPWNEFLSKYKVDKPSDLEAALYDVKASIVSSKDKLLGEDANGALVKTMAWQPNVRPWEKSD
jgi:hypothetical protein